jgi:hypothetical protein
MIRLYSLTKIFSRIINISLFFYFSPESFKRNLLLVIIIGDWACSPMVGRSSGTLPTRVQILMLAPFSWIYSGIFRRYTLSGPVDNEAPMVTSRIYRSAGAQSFRGAHRVGFACML